MADLVSFRHGLQTRARFGVIVLLATLTSCELPLFAQPSKSTAPSEAPSPEARAANKRALDLYKDGKYADALDQFQRAYDLSPSWVILCNIGKMSRFTQDFARSLTAYQRCLKDGGADVDGGQRTGVEQEIAQLISLVGWAQVNGEAGSELRVDGNAVGTLPLDHKLAVNPGPRTFAATKSAQHREELVTLKAGDSVAIDLAFDPGSSHSRSKTARHDGFRFPQAAVISTWVATGLFTATAVATGTASIATSSNLKGTVYVGPAQAPAVDSPLAKQARVVGALSKSTDVFIGLAAVCGVAAISFSVVNAVAPASTDAKASVGIVRVQAGPGSLVLTGVF